MFPSSNVRPLFEDVIKQHLPLELIEQLVLSPESALTIVFCKFEYALSFWAVEGRVYIPVIPCDLESFLEELHVDADKYEFDHGNDA
ncbi:hypothetical protein H5410_058139 [Solanum commersonii]|uniref:Uncharacterized protein n=1 Tax=Solanum commersonii TaxID=4109 RepID=A0A9J5WRS7_SOLCO|nr:hypothetical protein H5410_058139 [Solanum commersonii]